MSTESQVLIVVVLAALALLVVAVLASRRSRSRKQRIRERFGPEYDRAIEQLGNERRAERELAARERRVQKLHINELDAAHRVQFASDWAHAQTRFVDDPSAAVREADELIKTVMRARGYPVEDFERRVEDLSVDHANVVDHYRAARVLAEANSEGRANTEELRQALVHYRALFADLLEEPQTERRAHEIVRQEARGAH
jgi:FtsZ-interacting cell division protein ZipA